jgi:hypothetical protein
MKQELEQKKLVLTGTTLPSCNLTSFSELRWLSSIPGLLQKEFYKTYSVDNILPLIQSNLDLNQFRPQLVKLITGNHDPNQHLVYLTKLHSLYHTLYKFHFDRIPRDTMQKIYYFNILPGGISPQDLKSVYDPLYKRFQYIPVSAPIKEDQENATLFRYCTSFDTKTIITHPEDYQNLYQKETEASMQVFRDFVEQGRLLITEITQTAEVEPDEYLETRYPILLVVVPKKLE